MNTAKWQQVYHAVLKETGDMDAAEEAADLAVAQRQEKERHNDEVGKRRR